MSEEFQGYKIVTAKPISPFSTGEGFRDFPLKGIEPNETGLTPVFAYVNGNRQGFGRVHTNPEGVVVTEILLDHGLAELRSS